MSLNVGELMISVGLDTSGFDGARHRIESDAQTSGNAIAGSLDASASSVTTAAESKLSRFSGFAARMGPMMAKAVTLPIVGAGGAAFKMAADFSDAVGATETIFGRAGNGMKKWADKLPAYYGIAKDQALTYSNTMGSLLQNIGGMSEKESAKTSQKLTQLAGDLSAMFGGSTDTAVQALTGALKGNNEMLDNYGIAANDALIKQKALSMGLYDGTGEMSLQAKQAATLAIITEQTAKAQGQAKREADGASGSMKSVGTTVKNLAIDIGNNLLPIGAKLLGWIKGGMSLFQGLNPTVQKVVLSVTGLAAAVGPVLIVVGKLPGLFGALKAGVGALKGGFAAMNAVMAANPAVLIAIAVVALGAALYLAYQKVEWFRNAVDAVGRFLRDTIWPVIKDVAGVIVDALGRAVSWLADLWTGTLWPALQAVGGWISGTLWPIFQSIGAFIGDVFVAYVKTLASVWTDILWPGLQKVAGFISGTVIPIIGSIASTIGDVASWVGSAIGSIVGFVTGIPGRIGGVISTMWDGLKIGITVAKDWVRDRVGDILGFFSGIGEKIRSAIGGLADIIKKPFTLALDGVKTLWNRTLGGISFTIPDWVPGLGGKGFSFPKMHAGGVVTARGGEGDEVLRLLKVGETVRTAAQESQLQSALRMGAGSLGQLAAAGGTSDRSRLAPEQNVTVHAVTNADPHQIAAATSWALKTAGV